MKKAKPSPAAYNIIPRLRDFTFEEWRDFYTPIFDKVAKDIWKNCEEKGITKTSTLRDEFVIGDELADIRQKLELHFYEEYLLFKSGSDKRIFPSFPGGFYKWNWHKCVEMFVGYLLKAKFKIDSVPHDDMIWRMNQGQSDFFEEREQRVRDEFECNICQYFEEYVGVSVDDMFGVIFGFWWMGYNLRDIANLLTIGYKYIGSSPKFMASLAWGKGKPGICYTTIKRKLDNTFKEIEDKMGLSREEITEIRDGCIKRNPLAEKHPDPQNKQYRPCNVK